MSKKRECNLEETVLSAGEILQEAREKLNLTRGEIARKLYLSSQTIIDLENNDYTHMKAEVYIRGHLNLYAKAVKVPWEKVLSAFEAAGGYQSSSDLPETVIKQPLWLNNRHKERWKRGYLSFLKRWGAVLIMLMLSSLIIFYWLHLSSTKKTERDKTLKHSIQITNPNHLNASSS